MIVTEALNVIPAIITGSYGFYPGSAYIAIGTGSSTVVSGNTTLLAESDRNLIDTGDLSTAEEVTYIANFSTVELSGTIMKEYGTFTTGSAMLNREVLAGSLVFDGEQELQIQQTFKFAL